ncbi:MAG: heavy-metal-associated domain-containing protein [Flavobacteriales bacterium]|nr:heavy-metal-associated domain-containing protein [Flavobacteriales bacterium]
MKKLFLLAFLLVGSAARSQDTKGSDTLLIHTNAVCDMCEKTIETELVYERGVKAVDVDLEQNTIMVSIDPKKTDREKVRTAVTKLGYSADGKLPDMAAREKLPDCCKKEGCGLPAHPAHPEQKN